MDNTLPMIVLVDDDRDFLDLNKEVLEDGGYRTICFVDPQSAIAYMREEKPDLVITDLMMEDLDSGFAFSRRIKEEPEFADVFIIIVTAASSRRGFDFRPRTSDELAAMRADAYFSKPVPPGDLLAKVRELLNGRREKERP
ncbi:MAG: response regulator [Planctomycetota bacterium]